MHPGIYFSLVGLIIVNIILTKAAISQYVLTIVPPNGETFKVSTKHWKIISPGFVLYHDKFNQKMTTQFVALSFDYEINEKGNYVKEFFGCLVTVFLIMLGFFVCCVP